MRHAGLGDKPWRRVPLAILLLLSLTVYLTGTTVAFADAAADGTTARSGPTGPAPTGPTAPIPPGPTGPAPTGPPGPAPSPEPIPAPTESIIAHLAPGLTQAEADDVIARNGGVEISQIAPLRLHVVALPPDDGGHYLDTYRADPDVESADKDRTRDAEGTPNDPDYGNQWALPQIGWDQAFGVVDPAGSATIAVLDTGVEDAVTDIPVTGGGSAFATDPLDDPNGHGTALASIAAATTDNNSGIAGVAYDGVNVQSVQVLDAAGLGQDSDIIMGVVWAVQNGADVILMGFSNPGFSSALQDAVDWAWSNGAVLVAATGNDGVSTPTYPAGDAKVVGVSATDQSDALASWSNSGADTFIAAPGVGISAADTVGGTTSVTGTSAAAANVAGAATLLMANDPFASNAVIVGRLARNADPAG